MPQPPSPALPAVPAHIVLDQHAEGSGSCAEGGDGVSGESLETTGSYFAENESVMVGLTL